MHTQQEENLQKEKQFVTLEQCMECGDGINVRNYPHIAGKGLCFNCNHWMELYLGQEAEEALFFLRINGTHYQTPKDVKFRFNQRYPGFGGRKFIIKIIETGEVVETCNLWCQGDIPQKFRGRLYDNAEFVNDVTKTVVFDGE